MTATSRLERLVSALQDPRLYDHPVQRFQVLETHISYVLLTGPYAYKLKKPLDLGFLDFSTLEKRRHFCNEELRLNRRLAPQIYLDVVPISGDVDAPRLGGPGEAIDYAVKMVQFPPDDQLDLLTRRGGLRSEYVDQIADSLAAFHEHAPGADSGSEFGTPQAIADPVRQNFRQLAACCVEGARAESLRRLDAWSESTLARSAGLFAARRAGGSVRECHGDLHLGNMVLYRDKVLIFDCLEFNPQLRWIDTMSDAAFLIMDLHYHELPHLAHRFLNRYLEGTGDYRGLAVLDHYLVYRAMVRAKVSCIRAQQDGTADEARVKALGDMDGHLRLAQRFAAARRPRLIITHGLSGSGKTVVSASLVEALGAVRIRSDVERKRLAGLAAGQRSGSGLNTGLYTSEMTGLTYERLLDSARTAIEAGYSAIVDAAFLQGERRLPFRQLARELSVPFALIDVHCAPDELRRRIVARAAAGGDASEASLEVLEQQLRSADPLSADEQAASLVVDTTEKQDLESVVAELRTAT